MAEIFASDSASKEAAFVRASAAWRNERLAFRFFVGQLFRNALSYLPLA